MTKTIMYSVHVEGGTFTRGEIKVTVSSFQMGKYQVTQAQYERVVGTNPSEFKGGKEAPQRPVENLSWFDAVAFCNKLSQLEGLTPVYDIEGHEVSADFAKNGWRLPTEAEWEYAARGGKASKGSLYSGAYAADAVAWSEENSGDTTHAVGKKAANELGLHDMSGNVWEWCWDWYGAYPGGAQTNPTGGSSGSERVTRGGSWRDSAGGSRVTDRYSRNPDYTGRGLGFRVQRRPYEEGR